MAFTVYILKSTKNPKFHYVGITQNLKGRLKDHNKCKVGYTKHNAPWKVETFIVFKNRELATNFEKYLKKGSGHAFLQKRLLP